MALLITSVVLALVGFGSLDPLPLVAALVLFFIAIIGLFVGLSVEYEEHKKNELKQKPEVKQPEISQSDWETLKQKQRKKAVVMTIVLIVLYLCLVILFSSIQINGGFLLLVIGALFFFIIIHAWSNYKSKQPETQT